MGCRQKLHEGSACFGLEGPRELQAEPQPGTWLEMGSSLQWLTHLYHIAPIKGTKPQEGYDLTIIEQFGEAGVPTQQ